ncbi:MAG: 50S ribosomal protein L30 [Synergistetes bacterium]|nr:MAG: 50S ribosomal protein L30 [bacterium 42_11]MBC7331676.1 50S ribosomal protein L30 [Synergistota bacterium]MDK2872022.1 large subunit ribosomal protein [bacterium]
MKKLRIKWVKSFVGYSQDQRDTIRALGFRKLNQVLEKPDTPEIRGMIKKVHHLVQVEEGIKNA